MRAVVFTAQNVADERVHAAARGTLRKIPHWEIDPFHGTD
jgi:hypothetical protein